MVAVSRISNTKTPVFYRKQTIQFGGNSNSNTCSLYSLLETVLERVDGSPLQDILTSLQQVLATASQSSAGASAHTTPEHEKGLTAHVHFQVDELEDLSIHFLSAHSGAPNWKQTVSLQNHVGQSLAHLSVMLGYLRLLSSLVQWGIDLNLTDLKGSTPLYYAFLCNEPACAVFLIRWGADELALDELGRSPWELNPCMVDEVTSQLRVESKADGSYSVICRPMNQEYETEPPEDAANLRAKWLLVQKWLQQMEVGQHSTDCLGGDHIPRSGTAPACLPPYLRYENGKSIQPC
jgi:hypothetical protein